MANIFRIDRPNNKIELGTTGTTINVASHTASTILGLDASKDLESLAIPLIVANGGTGLATITDHGILLGSGTGAITPLGVAANGKIPIGSAGADPVLAEITGTANQIISTPGAGSITLSTPQNIHTGASPIFVGGTFSAVVTGVSPVTGDHFAIKEYVDMAIGTELDLFLSDNASGVGSNYFMFQQETGEVQSTLDTTTDYPTGLGVGDDQLIFSFLTEAGQPNIPYLRDGIYDIHAHLNNATGKKPTSIYWTLSYVDADGSSNETLVVTSETSSELTDSEIAYDLHAVLFPEVSIAATKRLLVKVYANVSSGGGNAVITITMEGTTDSHVSVEAPSSIWQRHGDVLDDINTLGQVGANGEFLVGTGAGVFQYEATTVARTSLGVGIGDSPTFAGVGIGTTTIPHGGVGWAKFAMDGASASATGPHIQFTTTSDNYPLMQILNYRHDDISIRFDSYWDGANKSSDAGSNYAIFKVSDLFKIMYDSGVAKGAAVAWNDGIVLNTSGLVTIPNTISIMTGIELGHASDTTITRVSAGVIAVEGVTVMLVGGAPTAHTIASHSDTTGTGAELNTLTDGSETALHSHAGGDIAGSAGETEEFNAAAPTAFTDLDLPNAGGQIPAANCLVFLMISHNSGATRNAFFRKNGSALERRVPISSGLTEGVWVETDASGIIEWYLSANNTTVITSVAFIRL